MFGLDMVNPYLPRGSKEHLSGYFTAPGYPLVTHIGFFHGIFGEEGKPLVDLPQEPEMPTPNKRSPQGRSLVPIFGKAKSITIIKGNRNGAVVGDAMVQLTIVVVHHGKTISENDILHSNRNVFFQSLLTLILFRLFPKPQKETYPPLILLASYWKTFQKFVSR